jgi:hypothetical protein
MRDETLHRSKDADCGADAKRQWLVRYQTGALKHRQYLIF